jgi:hypothetical protein
MRISTRVVIDMETMEVVERCAFDYEGPVAECKGGGSTTTYAQSPEAAALYKAMLPAVHRISSAGAKGRTLYQPHNLMGMNRSNYSYGVPSTQNIMPTQAWYQGLSPEVMGGLWAPWEEAGQALTHRLNAMGQLGSMRGGVSGSGETAMANLAADAATQVPLQAWQMTQPGMMAGWQAELGRNQFGVEQRLADTRAQWQAMVSAQRMPYEIVPGMAGGSMPQPVVQSGGK